MENEHVFDVKLQNELRQLGFDHKELAPKTASKSRGDIKTFVHNFEFESFAEDFKRYQMQIDFGVEPRPFADNSFQVVSMLCKAFPVGANVNSDRPLHTEYYHRDGVWPGRDEIVAEMALSILYFKGRKEIKRKPKPSSSVKKQDYKSKWKVL